MTKAVRLTTKADQLAFCRQCRAETAEALERYRTGEARYRINKKDVTRSRMEGLRQTIRELDTRIKKLEAEI